MAVASSFEAIARRYNAARSAVKQGTIDRVFSRIQYCRCIIGDLGKHLPTLLLQIGVQARVNTRVASCCRPHQFRARALVREKGAELSGSIYPIFQNIWTRLRDT